MAKEHFELVAGHIIIDKGGKKLLVDTGSPVSFGKAGALRIFNRRIFLGPVAPPLDAAEIGAHIGALLDPPSPLHLDGLLGTDLFRGLEVIIDWAACTITTRAARSGAEGWRGDLIGGLPSARIRINGHEVLAVTDTGARTCFAVPRVLAGVISVGSTSDFFPTYGAFRTTLHSTSVEIDGRREQVEVAKANEIIVLAMAAARAEALVGTDLMRRLGPTRFIFPRRFVPVSAVATGTSLGASQGTSRVHRDVRHSESRFGPAGVSPLRRHV